jgi:hypothetical protein
MSIDQDFASRCILKADYWSDPVGWTEQQKNDRLMNLDACYALELRRYLRIGRYA